LEKSSLPWLKSVHSIEPDICPKAERVCSPNDPSCCFIITDIDGGSTTTFSFGTDQTPGLSFWSNNVLMFRRINVQITQYSISITPEM
jgi:hypothetical protein